MTESTDTLATLAYATPTPPRRSRLHWMHWVVAALVGGVFGATLSGYSFGPHASLLMRGNPMGLGPYIGEHIVLELRYHAVTTLSGVALACGIVGAWGGGRFDRFARWAGAFAGAYLAGAVVGLVGALLTFDPMPMGPGVNVVFSADDIPILYAPAGASVAVLAYLAFVLRRRRGGRGDGSAGDVASESGDFDAAAGHKPP